MNSFSFHNKWGRLILNFIQKYNHAKYWRRRDIVINPENKTFFLIKLYYLYYIKKTDAYHNCSFGTNLNSGAIFKSPPILPHGPNGIIVGHDLVVGSNVILYHQVTLAHGGSKIGANCVVVENIPQNATVVLPKPRIILKS